MLSWLGVARACEAASVMAAFSGSSAPDSTRILVTGATDGLGRTLVLALAGLGYQVLVHGRSLERVAGTCALARRQSRCRVEGYVADLASLRQVNVLVDDVLDGGGADVVINNAAVGFGGAGDRHRRESEDGIELRLAANYLASMLLTRRLLTGHAPARIVQVASVGQHPLDFDDLESRSDFDPVTAYRRSKLALIMGSLDLASRCASTTINCVHPATYMPTKMVLNSDARAVDELGTGVAAVLHQAIAPELAGTTGEYFKGLSLARAHPQAYDRAARRALSEWTGQFITG